MNELIYTLPAVLAAALAWDAWRRYLAHREHITNESLAAMRAELKTWQDAVRTLTDEVNILKRSTTALLPRGRGRGRVPE